MPEAIKLSELIGEIDDSIRNRFMNIHFFRKIYQAIAKYYFAVETKPIIGSGKLFNQKTRLIQ